MTDAAHDRFARLLEEHKGILWKIAGTYGFTAADRQDLVQEIAVQLWRSFGRFDERLRFSTWAYRVGLNVAISWVRSETARVRRFVPAEDAILEVAAPAAESDALEEELSLLRRLVGGLHELDRALVLLWMDGRAYTEIGEVLGISASNVGTRLGRVKERLRRDLAEEGSATWNSKS